MFGTSKEAQDIYWGLWLAGLTVEEPRRDLNKKQSWGIAIFATFCLCFTLAIFLTVQ